jgi:hypothetical protein
MKCAPGAVAAGASVIHPVEPDGTETRRQNVRRSQQEAAKTTQPGMAAKSVALRQRAILALLTAETKAASLGARRVDRPPRKSNSLPSLPVLGSRSQGSESGLMCVRTLTVSPQGPARRPANRPTKTTATLDA